MTVRCDVKEVTDTRKVHDVTMTTRETLRMTLMVEVRGSRGVWLRVTSRDLSVGRCASEGADVEVGRLVD